MSEGVVCFQYALLRGSIVVHRLSSHALNPFYFQFIINATELRRHPAYSLSYIVVSVCILHTYYAYCDAWFISRGRTVYSYTYTADIVVDQYKKKQVQVHQNVKLLSENFDWIGLELWTLDLGFCQFKAEEFYNLMALNVKRKLKLF